MEILFTVMAYTASIALVTSFIKNRKRLARASGNASVSFRKHVLSEDVSELEAAITVRDDLERQLRIVKARHQI